MLTIIQSRQQAFRFSFHYSFNFFMCLKMFIMFRKIYLLIFCLCHVFLSVCGLSLVVVTGGYSSLLCMGLLRQHLFLRSTGSRVMGFRSCSSRLYTTQAQELSQRGLVASWHVGSFLIRVQTCVPCIGRWILHHQTSREALIIFFFYFQLRRKHGLKKRKLFCLYQKLISVSSSKSFHPSIWLFGQVESSQTLKVYRKDKWEEKVESHYRDSKEAKRKLSNCGQWLSWGSQFITVSSSSFFFLICFLTVTHNFQICIVIGYYFLMRPKKSN